MTGTGTTFSAGVDLLRLLDEGPDYAQAFVPVLTGLFEIVFDFPKPVGHRLLKWPFERIIVTHGDVLESGGRGALESAFAAYLQ